MPREREYELLMVLSPALDETGSSNAVENVHKLISDRGGNLTAQEAWGLKRLAYPLQDFREGNYHLARFTIEVSQLRDLDASLRLREEVLRHLLTRVEA